MTFWQNVLLIAALFGAGHIGSVAARRRRAESAPSLPELLTPGHSISDPDTGERWTVTHAALDMTAGHPRLSVDFIRQSSRTTDPEGA